MKAIAHNPLPLATTSAFTPRSVQPEPGGKKSAWSLAFVRAMNEGPFPSAPCPGPQRDGQNEGSVRVTTLPQTGLPRVAAGAVARVTCLAEVADAAARPEAVATSSVATACTEADHLDSPRPTAKPMPGRAPEQRASVRLHVEQHPDGVAIWLGCDADVPPAHVATLLEALRAHSTTASIVCNGTLAYARSPRHQETP